jgi:TonB family protein
MPVFPGGEAGMMKFLQDNIKYPAEAKQAGASGRVLTRFIINTDGSISDVEIYKSVHPLLDAEALRVVNEMPNWTPGKVDGKAVKVRYALPISFRLQGGDAETSAVSKAPEYPGGEGALMTFLARNMKYPAVAQESGIQGRVQIEMTIAANGSIVNPHAVNNVHPSLESEALRVVGMMERWNPAVNERGQAISSVVHIPFSFFLASADGTISNRDRSVEAENEVIIVGQSNK